MKTINAYHFVDQYSTAFELKIILTYEMANQKFDVKSLHVKI